MEKKFALVTEYGEINDSKAVKDIRAGRSSVYEAFNAENGTRNGNYEEEIFSTLKEAQSKLAKLKTIVVVRKNAAYFLDCEVSYIEERNYDESGEYDLSECGNVWNVAKEEIIEM